MFFISQNVVLAKQPSMGEELPQILLNTDGLSFGEGALKLVQQGKYHFQIYNDNYDVINPIAFSFNDSVTAGTCYFYNPMTGRIESADMYEEEYFDPSTLGPK